MTESVQLPERFASAAVPVIPTVGRVVHYYERGRNTPFAAVVSGVYVHTTDDMRIVADVDLTVLLNESETPAEVHKDVPGIIPGVEHTHPCWWQWPDRS